MKNPFFETKPGVLEIDDIAVDRLIAKGTVFGACNVALVLESKELSGNAGVSADEAAKEWAANVIPGITIIPSGTRSYRDMRYSHHLIDHLMPAQTNMLLCPGIIRHTQA